MFIIYEEPMIDRLSTGIAFLASRLRRYNLMYYTNGASRPSKARAGEVQGAKVASLCTLQIFILWTLQPGSAPCLASRFLPLLLKNPNPPTVDIPMMIPTVRIRGRHLPAP